jgi:hypothetical protein
LVARGWYVPGMRALADLECRTCHRRYYGDLPTGHGVLYPMLLDRASGQVHDQYGVTWFADALRQSYQLRTEEPLPMAVREYRALRAPLLLNCLDVLYGHALLKLLNAQYYLDHTPEHDLIVLVPSYLEWLVPDGVAAVWSVDLPLRRGSVWSDWLAAEVHRRLQSFDRVWLSLALPHPHPRDFAVDRFTRVAPFAFEEWPNLTDRPTVTVIWRPDRRWESANVLPGLLAAVGRRGQARRITALANSLGEAFPKLDIAVVGIGAPGGLPASIADLRTDRVDERTERAWCERYAASHVVIGVHGSSMLLPSALAGAVVELVPPKRWGNVIQDLLPSSADVREALMRHRLVPLDTDPQEIARIVRSLIEDAPAMAERFLKPWCDHQALSADPLMVARRHRARAIQATRG